MKGQRILILCILLLLAAGCAQKDAAAEDMDTADAETTVTGQASGETDIVLNEQTEGDETSAGIVIRIYHSDSNCETLCVNTERTEQITPDALLLNLATYGMIPDTTEPLSFSEEETDGEKRLTLDLSADFGTYLSSMGTAGETMTLGSLVNTFLDAYQAAQITLTCEGNMLETGHAIYEEPFTMYDYVEASYALEDAAITAEGVTFHYPQLAGLEDAALQEMWNVRMKGKAESWTADLEEGTTVTASYEVMTMNDELLSILTTGELYAPQAAYPTAFAYTFNIDMQTGESVRLAHYRDVTQIAEAMLDGQGYTVEGELAGEFQERLTILYGDAEQLAATLRGFDFAEGQENPAGYSYQQDGKTYLCMEVPHALGDYVKVALE